MIGIVVALVGVVIAARRPAGRPGTIERADDRASSPARGTPVTPLAPLPDDLDLQAWAGRTTGPTGVPTRALIAYGTAERAQRAATPDCRLSWATLAAIGRVESNHGRLGGAVLDADGVARPRIVGVPLDGSPGVAEVPDTDGGRLDGDPVHDRAVGPMQFLPATWARYGADGDGDGVRDPHDLDDAAAAAAAAAPTCAPTAATRRAGTRRTATAGTACSRTTARSTTRAGCGRRPTGTPPRSPDPRRPGARRRGRRPGAALGQTEPSRSR